MPKCQAKLQNLFLINCVSWFLFQQIKQQIKKNKNYLKVWCADLIKSDFPKVYKR